MTVNQSKLICHITGNPNVPGIVTANIRASAGSATTVAILLKAPVGTRQLPVLEVQIDPVGTALNGKVYQWFKVQFPDGVVGWVRDDLVSIEGDGSGFGYPILAAAAYAFGLTRSLTPVAMSAPAPTPAAPPTPAPAPAAPAPAPSTPATPPTPVAPVAPAPAPTPVTPAPAPAPAPIPGLVTGMVIGKTGINVRETPITGTVKGRIDFNAQVKIVGGQPQGGTSNYIWVKVDSAIGTGWVRNDFLSISGDATSFGLSKGDEWPAPMVNDWWVRGFNDNQNPNEAQHLGWDFGANVGEPVLTAPVNGKVTRILTCTKCTAAKPSTVMQGFSLGDTRIFNDPAWGFGYGNAVVVRYLNADLPQSTKDRLTAKGWGGSHLYVMYAHLSTVVVGLNQDVGPGVPVGGCGNTGNSEASHLHLEVRASVNPQDTNWSAMRPRLLDPGVAFLR
ncbi:MAG: peptidoglycan DD-metalloendopeptidase family protein [Chloroflexi bacterium]|uniref:M23 family metallopeptidase n=1 Tax=Candidatus Flexifilum breve TaxID=3140694 RepID=UPI003136AFB7|nr:peptidoglycan DD-metalloendopeptidase family protein [Chloroflexota bacterium]